LSSDSSHPGVLREANVAKARVLVVDDEPNVLEIVARVLDRAGYETTTAPGPLQALEIITIRGGFDLVVSDVVMPEMCGSELAEQVRLLAPSSAVMLMSGCVPVERLPRGIPFLGKPFLPSDLLRAVDKVLQASSLRQL
jgi:DNA-binding NtrC family response regulator